MFKKDKRILEERARQSSNAKDDVNANGTNLNPVNPFLATPSENPAQEVKQPIVNPNVISGENKKDYEFPRLQNTAEKKIIEQMLKDNLKEKLLNASLQYNLLSSDNQNK